MENTEKLAITISRQIGSGGAFIGKRLAQELDFYYADRVILSQAAQELSVMESDIEDRDEKLQSYWASFFEFRNYAVDAQLNTYLLQPTSYELFVKESEIIRRIAREQPAVIIGRCAFHVLKDHPNKLSVFLYADKELRIKRVQELHQISESEAKEMVDRTDKERARFIEEHSGKDWMHLSQYDLCIDTGKLGLENCVKLILNYVEIKK